MLRLIRNAIRRALQDAPGRTISDGVSLDPLPPSDQEHLAKLDADLRRMRAQWSELELHWAEVLDKLTAWASRQATRDRRAFGKRLEAAVDDDEPASAPEAAAAAISTDPKVELRRRAYALRSRS